MKILEITNDDFYGYYLTFECASVFISGNYQNIKLNGKIYDVIILSESTCLVTIYYFPLI